MLRLFWLLLRKTEKAYEELCSDWEGRLNRSRSRQRLLYYTSYSGENEYPIYLRKPSLDAELHPNVWRWLFQYWQLCGESNKPFAYSGYASRRIYTVYVKREVRKLMSIRRYIWSVVWAKTIPTSLREERPADSFGISHRHKLGTSQSEDVLVWRERPYLLYLYQ